MFQIKSAIYVFAILSLVLLFQNCGKVQFKTADSTLTTSNAVSSDADLDSPTPTPTPTDPRSPNVADGDDSSSDEDKEYCDKSDAIIECELGSSSNKIVLAEGLSTGSNKIESRICMSKHACLELVNKYAETRSCSLAKGAPSDSTAEASCTKVFPGSKGTCKKARHLSDQEVVNLLANMSK